MSLLLGTLLFCFATSQAALLPSGGEVLVGATDGSFSCEGRGYGYFADMESGCQLFHVCVPVADPLGEVQETLHFPFFCGNLTMFNQETLTCTHPEDAFPCEQAQSLYDLSNARFGVVPEGAQNDLAFEAEPLVLEEDLTFV